MRPWVKKKLYDMTPKIQNTKEKQNWIISKVKRFLLKTLKRMKKQATDYQKLFAKQIEGRVTTYMIQCVQFSSRYFPSASFPPYQNYAEHRVFLIYPHLPGEGLRVGACQELCSY